MMNNKTVDLRLTGEQVRMVYKHLPMAVAPPILAAAIVAFLFSPHVPEGVLKSWVTWVAVSYLSLPTSLYAYYKHEHDKLPNAKKWGRLYTVMALLTALSWGGAGVILFVPEEPVMQAFLAGMLFVSAVSVLATTFAYTPAYYAGVVPILLPLAGSFLLVGNMLTTVMSGLIVLSFAMLGYFQYYMNKSLADSLSLRYEREDLVSELEYRNQEVVQSNQAKSRFLAAVSHDLRQPMHAQQLLLGELSARLEDTESRSIVDLLRQSMGSMKSLLDGLLDVSRLDAGIVRAEFSDFDLGVLLGKLEREFKGLMTEKGLVFRATRCRLGVRSDPVLLERMLRNLLHNALRYTDSGAVMLICRRRPNRVLIEVRDSGPGIPADKQDLIFEEFVQLHNPARQREHGLGLGLAIVRRLSQLLDHRISLRSAPGKGSTFVIALPVVHLAPELDNPAWQKSVRHTALAGLSLVVIDDDRDILRALELPLRRWGCVVYLTDDPQEVFEQMRSGGLCPDIIITDYRLAGGASGLDWATRIRAAAPSTQIIVLTGDTAPERLREARAHGAVLMHKPVETAALYDLLSNLNAAKAERQPT
jgi:signal transduction histidine kinase/ActR/RegA family two-component response regulator